MPTGPVRSGFLDGAWSARPSSAGAASSVGIDGRLIIDRPAFYGDLVGALVIDGSHAFDGRTEVFARIEAVRYQMTIAR